MLSGQTLPSPVGATSAEPLHALCIGPGDWLIVSLQHSVAGLLERIEPELAERGIVLADLSDGLVTFDVQGSAAHELLSKGCGLDFHPRCFPPARCARTRFAQIPLLIECLDASPRFELTVAGSYAHYLYAWLADAAVEFES